MKNDKQIVLTVISRGTITTRGEYGFITSKDNDDKLVTKLTVGRPTQFGLTKQVVHLKEAFTQGCIEEPPMSNHPIPMKIWNNIPVNKRIDLHIHRYVRDMFPGHKEYSYEII